MDHLTYNGPSLFFLILLSEAWGASGSLRQALGDLALVLPWTSQGLPPSPEVLRAPVPTLPASLNYSFSKKKWWSLPELCHVAQQWNCLLCFPNTSSRALQNAAELALGKQSQLPCY